MENTSPCKKTDKTPVTVGLLAHVDAGKTTLAEALLYTSGKLRAMGRVDHKDAFLDTFALERQRGITIFSKLARMDVNGRQFTLLDTPGHVDFSAETERTLSVLDYAVLIISGPDGITGHTLTLWRLLKDYNIPVFIFVNKTDRLKTGKDSLLPALKAGLSENCIDFSVRGKAFFEEAATGSEEALEQFLETGSVPDDTLRTLILSRDIFPCFFGSALKLSGTEGFLRALECYTVNPVYPESFAARVYKISHDEKGERLTHLKVTGGTLKVKSSFPGSGTSGDNAGKINQIRIYDGAKYTLADEVCAGSICAVTGPSLTKTGDCLGDEKNVFRTRLFPVLTYKMILPAGSDAAKALSLLRLLEEEDPLLSIDRSEASGEICVRVMGTVQLEVLKSLAHDRFGLDITFGEGSIIYKETIRGTVEGVGHFEPLKHYAEVHLLLEPAEAGSGLSFRADCSEDILDRNWQRLILTHLKEKRHAGVLTGSELTDMKITLKSGRAHVKHTEGGDFRQATYRAVRQGLMQAESVLLEPYYSFRLEIPSGLVGRAMSDITRMSGSFAPPEEAGGQAFITGSAPVSEMRSYPAVLTAYSHGEGRIFFEVSGYEPCHNAQDVIAQCAYSAERDTENPSSSVFCSHGSGYIVPWNEVKDHMHLESVLKEETSQEKTEAAPSLPSKSRTAGEDELKEIFERTYGSGSYHKDRSEYAYYSKKRTSPEGSSSPKNSSSYFSFPDPKPALLLVDGYNIIFAWDELKSLACSSIDAARVRLMEILSNYQAYRGMTLILVFDGYRVSGSPGESFRYHNIDVIYTKEGETADLYIEKEAARLQKSYNVSVATSDALEQLSIFSHGGRRVSARELYMLIEETAAEIRERYLDKFTKTGTGLFSELSEETALKIEEIMKREDEK